MTSLEQQLNDFSGTESGPEMPVENQPPKPRKRRQQSKHVSAFATDQPAPGEERLAVNLRHWNALGRTDPTHTKPFRRAGGFQGTAIKPIWTEKQMTGHFGPCGIGWGMRKPEFQLVPVDGNGELLVYCTVCLWYSEDGHSHDLWGVGGDKVIARGRDGLRTSDEAFKSAYTDALSNAMKHLGVANDVHMGLFDDNKYVREVAEEFNAQREAAGPPAGNGHGAAKPIAVKAAQVPVSDLGERELTADEAKDVIRAAVDKAGLGMDVFRPWYHALPEPERWALHPHMTEIKAICAEAGKLPAKPARKGTA